MKYNNHLNYRERQRFLLRVKLVAACITFLLIGIAAYVYISMVNQEAANTSELTTSNETTSYIAPSVKVFRSPFFQFQADKDWVEVANESTASTYVYRSLRSNLIEHELKIYVNEIPADVVANRVLPVNLNSDRTELMPIVVSEHCMKATGGTPRIGAPSVTMDRTTFRCAADTTNYTVVVAQIDGTSAIRMKRPDASDTAYTIQYSNLKATPDSSELQQIVESFQTR